MIRTLTRLAVVAALAVVVLVQVGCATCCQCARTCTGCPQRPGLVCTGVCGDSCFYCPAGSECSCDAQCLGPLQPAPNPAGGTGQCQRLPRQ